MRSSTQIRQEIVAETEKAKAIIAVLKEDDREANEEEQTELDRIWGTESTDGAITLLEKELEVKVRIENKMQQAGLDKLNEHVRQNRGMTRTKVPAEARRHFPLKNFENTAQGEKDAYDSGMYILAKIFNNPQAKQYVKEQGILAQQQESAGVGLEIVPEPLEAALLKRLTMISNILGKVRVSTMTSATHRIPDRLTGVTVYYPDELADITESNMTFGQILLTARKMACLTQISSEVQADGVISMVDTVVDDMAYQIALKIEDDIFNGDGTATYGSVTGLAGAVGAASVVTGAGPASSDFTLANYESVVALYPWFQGGGFPEWYCSSAVYANSMLPLKAAAGGTPGSEVTSGWLMNFLGYPVNIIQTMDNGSTVSTNQAYFGEMSQSVFFGQRAGVSIATSTDYKFNTDSIHVRAIARNAITVNNHDAAAPGSVVALATAAA